jgi:multiple sugar transport system substrate-binding protein
MQRRISRRGLVTTGLQVTLAGIALSACGGVSPAASTVGSASTAVSASAAVTTSSAAVTTATIATQASTSAVAAATTGSAAATTLQDIGWDAMTTLGLVQKFYQDEFTPTHPGIAVNVISTSGANFNDKITTLMAGGTPPDIMYVQDYMASSWVAKNVLTDLSSFANADKTGLVQQNWPTAIGFFQIGGKLYGLPKDFSSMVLYYNKDLFAAAGVNAPGNTGWSWDDFLAASHKLTKQGTGQPQWGFMLRTGSDSGFGPWMWQNGGDFYSDPHNPTAATFTLDQAPAVDAIQWYADLMFKEHVAPTADQLKNQGDLFAKGQIAMQQNWTSAIVSMRPAIKSFTFDVIPMPKEKNAAIPLTVVALGVPTGSKHVDDAWQAIAFYNGPSGSQFTLRNGWGVPPNQAIAKSAAFLQDVPPANKQVFLDQVQYARLWPQSAAWPDQRAIILKAVGEVQAGTQKAAEAIAAIKQQVLATQ